MKKLFLLSIAVVILFGSCATAKKLDDYSVMKGCGDKHKSGKRSDSNLR